MAAAGAHRYWRLFIVTGYNPSWVDINEIELRTSAGGSDITTPSTPVTASSAYFGRDASAVVDNSTSSMWTNNGVVSANNWLLFDLTTTADVAEVALYSNGSRPATVKIQYSDNGSTWTDATGTFTLSDASSWQTIAVEQAPPDPNAPQKTTLTLTLNLDYASFGNPNNVYAIDGQYATGGTNNTSRYYTRYYTNATSVIPAGAQILGTEYTIRGRVDTTAYGAYCDVSWDVWANAGNAIAMPTTDTTIVRGGPTTVLGTPTLSNLNNLVMMYSQTNSGGTTNWWVDYLGVNVYWKIPAAGNPLFFGEMF